MIKKFKEKIKQYALITGENEVEVYFTLVPIVTAVMIFILTAIIFQSLFAPMFLMGAMTLFFVAFKAIQAVIESTNTLIDVILLPPHEEPSMLD